MIDMIKSFIIKTMPTFTSYSLTNIKISCFSTIINHYNHYEFNTKNNMFSNILKSRQ